MKYIFAGLGLLLTILALALNRVTTVGGQEPSVPKLFSNGYATGHELAGFSGRPMVLVFGDSRLAGWNEFLVACEQDPVVSKLLKERFVGVFVDLARDELRPKDTPSIFEEFGNPKLGTTMVKDIRGPLLGLLEEDYDCQSLREALQSADKYLSVERSPLYDQMLEDPGILNELVQQDAAEPAKRAVRVFNVLEAQNPNLSEVNQAAAELGISPQEPK